MPCISHSSCNSGIFVAFRVCKPDIKCPRAAWHPRVININFPMKQNLASDGRGIEI